MDVWGIRKEAREISTTETMCKNTLGGGASKNKTDQTMKKALTNIF